jgi:hypothetical protein
VWLIFLKLGSSSVHISKEGKFSWSTVYILLLAVTTFLEGSVCYFCFFPIQILVFDRTGSNVL